MGLLDNGPHTVEIWVEEEVIDGRGNHVRRPKPGSPVRVTNCYMQPIASTRGAFPALSVKDGQQVTASHKLICRDAPLGWWSRVRWVDDEGAEHFFSVLGGPLKHQSSRVTRHLSATLREEV